MAKLKVTLDIPLNVMVNGSKEDYIKAIKEEAEKKFNHLNKAYNKINIKD